MSVDESNSAEAKSEAADTALTDVTHPGGEIVRLVQDNRAAAAISAAESLRLIQAFTKIRNEDDRLIIIELAEQLAEKSL